MLPYFLRGSEIHLHVGIPFNSHVFISGCRSLSRNPVDSFFRDVVVWCHRQIVSPQYSSLRYMRLPLYCGSSTRVDGRASLSQLATDCDVYWTIHTGDALHVGHRPFWQLIYKYVRHTQCFNRGDSEVLSTIFRSSPAELTYLH